jgi:dTDP-4-dehydrorhamnose reductase
MKAIVGVTGATGLLGRVLMDRLAADPAADAAGIGFSRAAGPVERVDLTLGLETGAWLDRSRPRVVVHLAAERRPDVFARNAGKAEALNVDATGLLAEACARRDIPLLFLSTNYVFDGTAPPYRPEDEPHPLNAYGRSKWDGERRVRQASSRHRILRVPMLYGPSDHLDESSVTVILRPFLEPGGPIPLDVRQTRYPASTPDVADAIMGLLPAVVRGEELPGVMHFCPDEGMTKLEMARIMAEIAGLDPRRAVPDTRPPSGAPRPENVRMVCPELDRRKLRICTPYREAMSPVLRDLAAAGELPSHS